MAHYAIIDHSDVVTQVFVGKNEDDPLPAEYSSWEQYYCPPNAKACLRTSYNTVENKHINGGKPFRKNYAGIGYTYDWQRDAFIPPKPIETYVLDEETCNWKPPE